MTDAQLHVLLSHLKAQLDDAIEVAETTLPPELKVQPEHSELTKRLVPATLLRPPDPFFPQLASLYQLQVIEPFTNPSQTPANRGLG